MATRQPKHHSASATTTTAPTSGHVVGRVLRGLRAWCLWLLALVLLLQVFFVARIGLMAWVNPESTAFMRSELWRRMGHPDDRAARVGGAGSGMRNGAGTGAGNGVGGKSAAPPRAWAQRWVDADHISVHLKRAVVAAEDDGFANHSGVDWAAMETAWQRNQRRTLQAQTSGRPVKLAGGSTITQQLAKNLLLSGERHLARKGQELLLAFYLEALLSKPRILEIYLNSVEWGDGVFGAEAAAQRYFGTSARQLNAAQAARLAVMLPAPKAFEKRPDSPYLNRRTSTIITRMGAAVLP